MLLFAACAGASTATPSPSPSPSRSFAEMSADAVAANYRCLVTRVTTGAEPIVLPSVLPAEGLAIEGSGELVLASTGGNELARIPGLALCAAGHGLDAGPLVVHDSQGHLFSLAPGQASLAPLDRWGLPLAAGAHLELGDGDAVRVVAGGDLWDDPE